MFWIFMLIAGATATLTTLSSYAVLVASPTTALMFGGVIVPPSLVSLIWHRFIA